MRNDAMTDSGSMRAEGQVRKGGTAPTENPAPSSPETETSFASGTSEHKLRIAEIYASLQGEGQWTGSPSVFLRTSGCNLRCHFCDTPFTSWQPEGDWLSLEDVIARVLSFDEPDVVITGGEPLLVSGLNVLCQRLSEAGRRITIETAGTIDREFQCDLLSISPKLSSSAPDPVRHPSWHAAHQARRERFDLVRHWINRYAVQLKFVVATVADAEEVLEYLATLEVAAPDQVWIMPEGTSVEVLESRAVWLEPWCLAHGFHFCQRQHIYWYGNRRGT